MRSRPCRPTSPPARRPWARTATRARPTRRPLSPTTSLPAPPRRPDHASCALSARGPTPFGPRRARSHVTRRGASVVAKPQRFRRKPRHRCNTLTATLRRVMRKTDATRPKLASPLDRAIAEEAERQCGVISAAQIWALGLSPRAVRHRAAAGRLHRVYPGVYAVGHAVLGPDGRRMAAVLACGPGAVLSHRSAADLWEIRPTARARPEVNGPRGR